VRRAVVSGIASVVSLVAVVAVNAGCSSSGRHQAAAPGSGAGESEAGDGVVASGPEVAASSATVDGAVAQAPVVEAEAEPAPPPTPPPEPPRPAELPGAEHRRRYHLANAKQTLVGDRGTGYDELYGTRNLRAVLDGVFYRGGANNFFHRTSKRGNKNPLPPDGLTNLCRQGFGTAVYLYPTNFDTAAKETTCETVDGQPGTLTYAQITSQHYHRTDQRLLFSMILDAIRDPAHGPVYAHCWNGWHASGYVSAIALRQFCGFTPAQALRYWTLTAKGASNADHEETKKRIDKFKPFPELEITAEERARLCPDPKTLAFPPAEDAPAP
jgi:hypothetical protein